MKKGVVKRGVVKGLWRAPPPPPRFAIGKKQVLPIAFGILRVAELFVIGQAAAKRGGLRLGFARAVVAPKIESFLLRARESSESKFLESGAWTKITPFIRERETLKKPLLFSKNFFD